MTTRRAQPSVQRRRGNSVAAPSDTFRLEGEYWTIVYQGALCRLRDGKGLRYLAHLLVHPGERILASGLAGACDYGCDGVDHSASRNPRSVIDERARLAVTKRIKAAIKKIEQHHPALGVHLLASIKTGYQCAYLPDPHEPISWSV